MSAKTFKNFRRYFFHCSLSLDDVFHLFILYNQMPVFLINTISIYYLFLVF